MRLRTVAVTSLVAVAAAGGLAPAAAAPKPITKKWTANAPVPDPSPALRDICDPVLPGSKHEEKFTVPAAGTLKVTMVQELDWALAMIDKSGKRLAESDGPNLPDVESMQVKFKKPTQVIIRSCNFAGGASAKMTAVFTFK